MIRQVEKIVSNYDDLYNPNIMKPDMKLRKINVCEDLKSGQIKGISFTIRTIGSKLVISHQLGTLGSSENAGNRCTSFPIQDDDKIKYIEIATSDVLDTFKF